MPHASSSSNHAETRDGEMGGKSLRTIAPLTRNRKREGHREKAARNAAGQEAAAAWAGTPPARFAFTTAAESRDLVRAAELG